MAEESVLVPSVLLAVARQESAKVRQSGAKPGGREKE